MWYQEEHVYDLTSKRIWFNHGPRARKVKVWVDGYPLDHEYNKWVERVKTNDRSVFLYPLRYGARVSVQYEVIDMLSMEQLQDMAAKFWIKTGESPTHLLMTTDQQNEFSSAFSPKERAEYLARADHANPPFLTKICVVPGVMIDILAVAVMRSGNQNPIELPKMIRIEE